MRKVLIIYRNIIKIIVVTIYDPTLHKTYFTEFGEKK